MADVTPRFVATNLGFGWYVLDRFLRHRTNCANRNDAVRLADGLNQRTDASTAMEG